MEEYFNLIQKASRELWLFWKMHYPEAKDKNGANKANDEWWDVVIGTMDALMRQYKNTIAKEYVNKVGMAYMDELEAISKGERY